MAPASLRVSDRVAPSIPPPGAVPLALVGLVAVLVAAMLAAALLIGRDTQVRVPALAGLTRLQAAARLRSTGLGVGFTRRYSQAPTGTAIAQSPRSGETVSDGSGVSVTLSAGPPPVRLPALTGASAAHAATTLGRLGLRAATTQVPAPGIEAGTVTAQTPPAGRSVAAGSTVALSVAEVPGWRTVSTFSGTGAGHSVPFRIRGAQWRVAYSMSYVGMCTFIVFCSGPTAHVRDLSTGLGLADFGLGDGANKTRTFASGPGTYEIAIAPGNDTARWSVTVQDRY